MKKNEATYQSEMFNCGGPIRGNIVEAVYTPSEDPMFRGNPFIEALPPIMSPEEFGEAARWHPTVEKGENKKGKHYRIMASKRILSLIEPLPAFLRFYNCFMGQLRFGYLGRNPPLPGYLKQLQESFSEKEFSNDPYRHPVLQNAASGSCVIGTSGVGKSTLVKTVLSLTPQVIRHGEYNGEQFFQQQLVYIFVSCFAGRTLKELVYQFLFQVEQLLDYPCYSRCINKNMGEGNLLFEMAKIARISGLGALVIDEVQNLQFRETKSGEKQKKVTDSPKLLKTLVTFSNIFDIPIVFIGTPDAEPLIGKSMPLSRRATQSSEIKVKRLRNGKQFKDFLEVMWKYNFLEKEEKLTPEISKAFYEASQGVVAALVGLFMFVQWEAIYSKAEKISPNLIQNVAKTHFGPLNPWLSLIKKGREKYFSTPELLLPELSYEAFLMNKESKQEEDADENGQDSNDGDSASSQPKTLTAGNEARRKKKAKSEKNYDELIDRGLIEGEE